MKDPITGKEIESNPGMVIDAHALISHVECEKCKAQFSPHWQANSGKWVWDADACEWLHCCEGGNGARSKTRVLGYDTYVPERHAGRVVGTITVYTDDRGERFWCEFESASGYTKYSAPSGHVCRTIPNAILSMADAIRNHILLEWSQRIERGGR